MTPMKDIVAVGNFVLEAVRTSDAATGAADFFGNSARR